MRKRKIIYVIVCIILILVSATYGFAIAYILGLQEKVELDIRLHSYKLFVDSLELQKMVQQNEVVGVIDATELNGIRMASYLEANKPYVSSKTRDKINKALESWKTTEQKLKKMRLKFVQREQLNSVQAKNN